MELQTGKSENITPNTQNTVNGTHSDDSNLVKVEPIEGSPFSLVKNDKQYFIALGDYRITDIFETPDEALDTFITEPWNITVRLITIVVDKHWKMISEMADAQRLEIIKQSGGLGL